MWPFRSGIPKAFTKVYMDLEGKNIVVRCQQYCIMCV